MAQPRCRIPRNTVHARQQNACSAIVAISSSISYQIISLTSLLCRSIHIANPFSIPNATMPRTKRPKESDFTEKQLKYSRSFFMKNTTNDNSDETIRQPLLDRGSSANATTQATIRRPKLKSPPITSFFHKKNPATYCIPWEATWETRLRHNSSARCNNSYWNFQ